MGWDIIFDGKAQKQLLKLDIEIQRRIKTDFLNEKERMEFLFDLYAKITEPLID